MRLVACSAGDLDGLAGAREVQAADVSGLEGAGLEAAVPGVAGKAARRYPLPGQRLDPGIQQRLVPLDAGDVVAVLLPRQPVEVGPHGMEVIEGHRSTVQVQGLQKCGEVAGLVVLELAWMTQSPGVRHF